MSNTNSSGTRGILRSQTLSPKSSVQFALQPKAHQSFLKVRLEVQAHPEGATGASQALGKLLNILQAADKTLQLAIYKGGMLSPEKDALDKARGITGLFEAKLQLEPEQLRSSMQGQRLKLDQHSLWFESLWSA